MRITIPRRQQCVTALSLYHHPRHHLIESGLLRRFRPTILLSTDVETTGWSGNCCGELLQDLLFSVGNFSLILGLHFLGCAEPTSQGDFGGNNTAYLVQQVNFGDFGTHTEACEEFPRYFVFVKRVRRALEK